MTHAYGIEPKISMRHYTYVASNGSQEISHYSAQIYVSSVEMSTDTEGSKDSYDQCVFKFSKFSFEEQMSHTYMSHILYLFATTTKICTSGHFTQACTQGFGAHHHDYL